MRRVPSVDAGRTTAAGRAQVAPRLRPSGAARTVVEARDRIGGRVLSFNRRLGSEYIAGRNVEGGGELVGFNHPTWLGYAAEFGLELVPVNDDESREFPIWLTGRRLSPSEGAAVYEEVEQTLGTMTAEAATIVSERPWENTSRT